MPHQCHAENCTTEVPPEKLMCKYHWNMVPGPVKKQVCGLYRPGQCTDKRPSKEWIQAARLAISEVAKKET